MAGRHRLPPSAIKLREVPLSRPPQVIDDHRLLHRDGGASATTRVHPITLLEDRIAAQHREIQSLLLDNQRLAATHVALKQELSLAQQELRDLPVVLANTKTKRDNQLREVYENSLKLEAEARGVDAMVSDLNRVRADVEKLSAARKEAAAQLKEIDGDLARARSESQQLPAIKKEIESMHQEIKKGRAAIEYEKKTHASNLEHGQAMEKHMISVAREVEKLRAELANAEKRAQAAAAATATVNPNPGYALSYGIPGMSYGASPYPDPYGMHQVQGVPNTVPQYGSGAMLHGAYEMQETLPRR